MPPPSQDPNTILIVDDEAAVRNTYQLYLKRNGYNSVLTAGSVAEALRLLRENSVALALIDIFIDEEDGLEFLKGIVASEQRLPVIVMSGVPPEHPLLEEARSHGAAGIFCKSEPLPGLEAEIRRLIRS